MDNFFQLTRRHKIALALAALLVLALIVLTFVFLANNPPITSVVRDLFIIVLAVQLFVLDLMVILLLVQMVKLMRFLVTELMPVVRDIQTTTGTVRGTAEFMSESVVSPTIQVVSKLAGIRGSLDAALGGGRRRRSRQPAGPASGAEPSSPGASPAEQPTP
ncbi:MAG: hypothetical protein NZ528_11100 [Caldilineales bacterium]|nr:hypothetical protein [Caldilineales bacterium]MDW8318906.1 hypothetical protein [Anaerolineae bacterium]